MAIPLTLSIIASKPGTPADDLTQPTTGQINDLLVRLANRNDKVRHRVARAASVQEIRLRLDEFRAAVGAEPECLQILGHGFPGILSLGTSFGEPAFANFKAYELNSNYYSYGRLKDKIAPTTRILLFGCSVGDTDAVRGDDGPTLLFDLSHLLDCEVRAPVDDVNPIDDLDDDGIWIENAAHDQRLTVARDDRVEIGIPRAQGPMVPAPPPACQLVGMVVPPSVPGIGQTALAMDAEPLSALGQRIVSLMTNRLVRQPLLTTAELFFGATVDNVARTVSIRGNSRYICIDPTPTLAAVSYEVARGQVTDLKAVLRKLVALSESPRE